MNFRTGLTDITAMIFKPNGSFAGSYVFQEISAPFGGRYYFDYYTNSSDPEGEYFALITSPSEGIKTTERISLYAIEQVSSVPAARANLIGSVLKQPAIIGSIGSDEIEGRVIEQPSIQGHVPNPDTIDGKVQTNSTILGIVRDNEEEI